MPSSRSLTSSKRGIGDAHQRHIKKQAAEGDHISLLRDLLAIIHRDGGQYTELTGLDYSVIDAIDIIYALREANSELRRQLIKKKP